MTKRSILTALFSVTDEQAMWRVQTAEDYEAFARLVERWEGPIRELCRRMIGDAHRGEDLKQEAFARAFEKRKDYQPTAKFSTWLWRIALNLCYDELRRVNRRSESSLEVIAEANDVPSACIDRDTPDQWLVQQEEGEMVRAALMRLPEMYRTVVVLRHYQDLKLREIAEVLQIPKGTVVTRLAEAYARMTRVLEPRLNEEAPRMSKESYESSQT